MQKNNWNKAGWEDYACFIIAAAFAAIMWVVVYG
jgi:hypothetical protein